MTATSHPPTTLRTEDLLNQLGVGKDTLYRDLRYLGIEAQKDSEGKACLTAQEAEQVRALRTHVNKTGKREGFNSSSLVKVDNNNLATATEEITQENIYVRPEDPVEQFDVNALLRAAAELKAREIAMPALVKRALADGMNEDDLPDDLKEKIGLAREAANPKFSPAEVVIHVLSFPFEAVVDEFQERGPLRAGDQVTVESMADVVDLYGILVKVKHKRSQYDFPLCDLEATEPNSSNYRFLREYVVWFANQ